MMTTHPTTVVELPEGVTQKEYSAWRELQKLPLRDVWKAPQSDIETIYHSEYWDPYCDLLPIGLDYCLIQHPDTSWTGCWSEATPAISRPCCRWAYRTDNSEGSNDGITLDYGE
jgi:hypothetical protein